MIGKPKYKIDDKVLFKINNREIEGTVYIVDSFGVFEDNSDVHYDIMEFDKSEPICLIKHIKESSIIKKLN